ncbi:hypothetical protein FRB90_004884, partial [Tulasnella sp. 427]
AQNSVSGQTGGQAADKWNGSFGISTNYGGGQTGNSNGTNQSQNNNNQATTTTTTTTPAQQQAQTTITTPVQNNNGATTSAPTTTPGASASNVNGGQSQASGSAAATTTSTADNSVVTDVDGMVKDEQCTLQAILVTVTIPASQASQTGKSGSLVPVSGFTPLDLGTCTDPTVAFGQGLGGRQANEWAFMNNNIAQFPHGSTLDLQTILQFTCNNLVNRCGLSTNSPAVLTCNTAESDALKHGNTGLGVDIFNRGMGFSTYFAAVDGS